MEPNQIRVLGVGMSVLWEGFWDAVPELQARNLVEGRGHPVSSAAVLQYCQVLGCWTFWRAGIGIGSFGLWDYTTLKLRQQTSWAMTVGSKGCVSLLAKDLPRTPGPAYYQALNRPDCGRGLRVSLFPNPNPHAKQPKTQVKVRGSVLKLERP